MKTSRYILLMLGIVGLWSCSGGVMPVSEPQVVVEGWIENGAAPIVIVTSTVPVTEEIKDVNELRQYIVTWAKVTVSDGTESIVLTGRRDDNQFPPYVYTTSRMKGETGKSYTVTVECSGRKATATTTIPEPVALEYVKATRSSEDDGKILLTAGLKDNAQEKNYYKSFVKIKGKDTYYHPSFMGLIDDEVLEEEVEEIAEVKRQLDEYGFNMDVVESVNVHDDIKIGLPTRDGYTFMGWKVTKTENAAKTVFVLNVAHSHRFGATLDFAKKFFLFQ